MEPFKGIIRYDTDPGAAMYNGSFSGNTFNGSCFEQSGANDTIAESIEAVRDDYYTAIVSLDWSESHVNIVSYWTQTKGLSAQNITLGHQSSYMVFTVMGGAVTDHNKS